MQRRRAKPLLGTLVEIAIDLGQRDNPVAQAEADEAIGQAFAEVAVIHGLMSFHCADSDIGRINASAAGARVEVDARTAEVLCAAKRAAESSNYAFDCTVAQQLVADGLLPDLAPHVPLPRPAGNPAWRIDGRVFVKQAPCLLDLGGIAKGYAVDRAIEILRQAGCVQAYVNAGGDMRHVGPRPIVVHLRSSDNPTDLPLAVELQNQAMASSAAGGLYPDGLGHKSALIDGRSRAPIGLGAAVSVLASTCMAADMLTKVVLASRDPHHPMLLQHHATVAQYNGGLGAFTLQGLNSDQYLATR